MAQGMIMSGRDDVEGKIAKSCLLSAHPTYKIELNITIQRALKQEEEYAIVSKGSADKLTR